jgi:cell division protein FtsL
MEILRLSREEIDKNKWNSCVHFALNGNIFGYKWYLDSITKDWEALIESDYGSVFPLIWKKNWLGKKKLYQPELILDGGLYSEGFLSAYRVQQFFDNIPKEYKGLKITISQQTKIPKDLNLEIEKLSNRFLPLNQPYEGLKTNFSDFFNQQLEKAAQYQLQAVSNLKPEKIVDFYKKHTANYNKENYFAYLRIMYNVMHRGWGFANGVANKNGDLLAANFFIYSHGKILNYLPVVSKEGKEKGALELLMSLILQTHANKPVLLDFNGFEDIGLGSKEQIYYRVSK